MKRHLLVGLAIAALALASERAFRLQDDLVRSLVPSDPVSGKLFEDFQARSPYRGRIYVEAADLGPAERERLDRAFEAAGYREEPLLAMPGPERMLVLASQLPPGVVEALLGGESGRKRVLDATAMATLPGGERLLRQFELDPLGVLPALARELGGGRVDGVEGRPGLRAYVSPTALDYGKVEALRDELEGLAPRVHSIGGDFFALENYRAVRRDVVVCTLASLLLNVFLFVFFTRRWVLLWLVVVGSLVSYMAGLLAIRVFYAEIFAVVLVYTSTFVGFNNESLVHLSGMEPGRRSKAMLGIWSAIGTTLLGFVVMLLSSSVLVRQMALASIVGLVAFLVFLIPYRDTVRSIRFRIVRLPRLAVPAGAVAAMAGIAVAGLAWMGMPQVRTRVESLRVESEMLESERRYFQGRLDALAPGEMVAVPVEGSPSETLARLAVQGLVDPAGHPLSRRATTTQQIFTLAKFRDGWAEARARIDAGLMEAGLSLQLAESPPGQELSEWDYLNLLDEMGPVRWVGEAQGARFIYVGLKHLPEDARRRGFVPLDPRRHYDNLLTAISRQLGVLFLAGIAAMAVYLVFLQRSLARVLYIIAPVLVSALGFVLWSRVSGSPLTVVHFMGFSLVIAIAIDYTAVAISTDHGSTELSKILLTGLSAIGTFGVLLFARHPVLRTLGATVVAGAAPSLAFALLVRMRGQPKGSP
ncbi:MAG: hypothetical protein WB493_12385 [Anaeromyxobacteraceae bacterium]